jgi:uncharacterized protein (DUF305 family)
MKRLSFTALLTMTLVATPWLVNAQNTGHPADHKMSPPTQTVSNPATAAYEAANSKMHQEMAITFTGDADRDFLAGMIGHHQGAIDMSDVVLQYGKDAKVRKLAKAIIRAQKQEIEQMKIWLKELDRKAGKTQP